MCHQLLILLLSCASLALPANAATLTLRDGLRIHPPEPALPEGFLYWGTADTTLDASAPDADFGGADVLRLSPQTHVLIRFDQLLPALGGPFVTVLHARLILHIPSDASLPTLDDLQHIKVFRLLRSWNEGGRDGVSNYLAATYRSRYHAAPGKAIPWHVPGARGHADSVPCTNIRVSCDPANRTLIIDGLARDVNLFLARHYRNHGWLITLSRRRPTLVFHSRERANQSLRPTLVLEYQPVPPTPYPTDLGVVYIERYPEYFAWKDVNSYEQKLFRGADVGILKHPEFADVQKHPNPGDMLQYLGVVKNHGNEPIHGFVWCWRVNDAIIKTGIYTATVMPQHHAYVWFSHPCPANFADHRDQWLTLAVEPLQPLHENKNNNELTIFTKARCAGVHCDETSRAFYQSNYNAFGTYSFEDWIQFQLLYWNQIYMAKSRIRDMFPDGSRARVRLQRVEFFRDGELVGPVHVAYDWRDPRYDGLWGWDFGSLPDRAVMNRPDWFFRRTLRMCEPSLIHEMSHQCFGLMDVYCMTMEPAKNPITGEGGKVKLRDPRDPKKFLTGVGYSPKYPGLMGGGDTRYTPAHEGTALYADHDLCGLNQNAPYRGGFFGDYLYGIQTCITVRIITEDGSPAAGAPVSAWQSTYHIGLAPIDDSKLVFSNLVTDARGEITLPNQSILEDGPVTLLTGHTLRDNPFGRIHVCGFNGNILLHTLYRGKHYYYMIMVWEQNVRFARGARDTDLRVWRLGPQSQLETYEYCY